MLCVFVFNDQSFSNMLTNDIVSFEQLGRVHNPISAAADNIFILFCIYIYVVCIFHRK